MPASQGSFFWFNVLFPTTNPLPPTPAFCFFLQLASWNLQLSFNKRTADLGTKDKSSLWKNRLFPCRTENHSTVNRFLCSFLPRTRYPQPRPFAFSYNSQLATWNRSFALSYPLTPTPFLLSSTTSFHLLQAWKCPSSIS